MISEPLNPASDGRDSAGRFKPGNSFGLGNPHAKRIARIRSALFRAISPADIKIAVMELMKQAKAGDRFALSEILDRTIGRAVSADIEERLSQMETALLELQKEHRR